MGLEMKFNPDMIQFKITQIGERAMRGMSAKMREHAILIRDLARSYAPVKTGLLENNIDYRVERENRRNAYVVFIDLDAARASGEGELGDYAFIMEEELHPYGRQRGARYFTLGPRSRSKAASGKKVGGRFLSRAVRDGTKRIMGDLVNEVRKVTGHGRNNWAGVNYRRERHGGEEE